MRRITGVVQHYAWGDPRAIPELLGADPDGRPWAELWFGTHAGGPATLDDGSRLIDESGPLPYLLKVLAAAEALSLQTHPSAERAAAGFQREDAAGIPIDAPERIYRDPFAKPEMLVALTPFDALCGFRPLADTDLVLRGLGADHLADHLATAGLAGTVADLYRGVLDPDPTIGACREHLTPEAMLVTALAGQYPGDASVAVTLLLNRVTLAPGEAIFLEAGNLHAYVHGVGVEIMGASDNVVRGGLTPKHVDVEELLAVLDVRPLPDPVLTARHDASGWIAYDTPNTPFRLWRIELAGALHHTATGRELLLCLGGDLGPLCSGDCAYLARGETIALAGTGTLFRVEER